MADDTPDEPASGDAPGWAAPHLPPAEPAAAPSGGDAPSPEDATPAAPPPAAPPPPVGTPAPPAGAPAPPTSGRRKRRGWIVVLVSVLGVIVLAFAVGTVFFVSNTLPPFNAANDFVDDLRQGRVDAAADQLCRADQDDADSALSTVTDTFVGKDEIAVNPLSVDVDGDTATVEFTVTANDEDASDGDTYELPLVKQGDDWKPCPGGGLR